MNISDKVSDAPGFMEVGCNNDLEIQGWKTSRADLITSMLD